MRAPEGHSGAKHARASGKNGNHRPRRSHRSDHAATPRTHSLKAYSGLGTWVDMYDHGPWRHPERSIATMARRGVRTLYLQTSNWQKGRKLYKPHKIGRFLTAAHKKDMYVVAWYVPAFSNLHRDRQRVSAALRFRTGKGEKFDSFALDVESTRVDNLFKRNARLMKLTRWLESRVGRGYTLGGIVPDVQSLYWPGFPYDRMANHYDVLLPMSYFTFRVHGARQVKRYVERNFTRLRKLAGPKTPIHNIGGIGGASTRREVDAYVKAVKQKRGIGGSYYDYPIISDHEWKKLSALAR